MGREIRRVPADWEHPKDDMHLDYRPLFDRSYATEAREWMDKAIAWDNGTDPNCARYKAKHPFYWTWAGNPPNPKSYRPEWTSEPTHYQMYENVTEGTPVTPHFATPGERVDYLVKSGTFWDPVGWDRSIAERFVKAGYAPSMVMTVDSSGVKIQTPRDGGF